MSMDIEKLDINKCHCGSEGFNISLFHKFDGSVYCALLCVLCGDDITKEGFKTAGEALKSVIDDWNAHLQERSEINQ